MKVLELHLPDDLASKVEKLTTNAEAYIINLLQGAVNSVDTTSLANEYRQAATENKELSDDFYEVDLEGWDE